MIIKLDEHGTALPDVEWEEYLKVRLNLNYDIHVSNMLAIDILRKILFQMPLDSRPIITWIFYNKEVHFDKDMRSFDAFNDPRTLLLDDCLMALLG